MFQFGNPPVGGTTLLIPAIQSPNFVPGVSGWQINQDGSAEFQDLIQGTVFKGTNWIENAFGSFFYTTAGAPATIAPVQHAANSGTFTSGTNGTVNVTISPAAAGNCLVAAISIVGSNGVPSVSTVKTGTAAENWAVGIEQDDSTNTAAAAIWVDEDTPGGGTTIAVTAAFGATASASNGCVVFVDVFEFSGVATVSAVDKTSAGATGQDSSAWSSGATGATSQASEVFIGVVTATPDSGGSGTVTGPASPWVNEAALSGTIEFGGSPFDCYSVAGYQIASSVGTATYSGTTSVNTLWNAVVITLKAAGGSGAQQLYASIAPAPGNDAAWNPPGTNYFAGPAVYGTGGARVGMDTFNGGTEAYIYARPGGSAHMILPPQLSGGIGNAGAVNEFTGADLYSGSNSSGNDADVVVFTGNNDGSSSGNGNLLSAGVARLIWDNNGVHVLKGMSITTAAGMAGNPDISLFDNTVDTNANNGTQPCTKQWSIPAGDAQVGTVYVIESPFQAANATTTVEAFGYKPSLNGTALTTSGGDVIGATMLSIIGAGTKFSGEVRLTMRVVTTGATGTVNIFIKGGLANEGNVQGGSAATSAFFSSQILGQAFNTTVANTIAIDSTWGAASAGQTVSNYGSVLTRKGP